MPRLVAPLNKSDHFEGSQEASVTLVEYGDFECPYCGQAYPILKDLQREFGPDLRLVFRHFPLTQMHPHAGLAARAAETAGAQGKFWEMHDLLFEHQEALEFEDVALYATELGLDVDRFITDLKNGTCANKIHDDVRGGIQSGVNGTPTFFLNGVRYDDSWDYETLSELIRGMIQKAA
jgi:protein-disulfide isomerase